jgi:NAD(P)-dependent dehydrogenase (short-subunit alcohol dehydrogenase family)
MTALQTATERSLALEGRVALVTGGLGGLGSATCRALAALGAEVVAADLRAGPEEAARGGTTVLQTDLTSEASVEDLFDTLIGRFGHLDILINNAGIDVTCPIEELGVADWDRILSVNLRAPFLLSRLAFERMRAQGGGQIVNIVSTAARRTWANASAYHASKWGLLGLSHALHAEGRPAGIKVSAIVSGGMRTPFLLDRFPDIDESTLQEPSAVAEAIAFVLTRPEPVVVPEMMVLPMRETSWP